MADWLLPFFNQNQLALYRVKDAKTLPSKLRIIAEHKEGSFSIYDLGGQAAILDRIVSENVFMGKALPANDLARIENATELFPPEKVQAP